VVGGCTVLYSKKYSSTHPDQSVSSGRSVSQSARSGRVSPGRSVGRSVGRKEGRMEGRTD